MTRKALVVGNSKYPVGYDLLNTVNDAVAIAEALRRNGFEVAELTDVDHEEMETGMVAFGKSLERDGAAAFYFAGHGVEIDGVNYLVGINADPTNETSTKYKSLRLDFVVDTMDRAGCETNIVILDSCRENPFGKNWARSFGTGGLAPVSAPRGTLIAYSTSPGERAMDGKGSHGRYTEALLQHIDAVCPVETMFKRVRATMATTTGKKQTPWEHTSLIADFFFNRSRNVPITQYSDQAVKDGGFIADPKKPSHLVIAELKYRHYDQQNSAVRSLSAASFNGFSDSSCFMIGRALYAAADGDANAAKGWIASFVSNMAKVDPNKRKALLDGMLFEVFFDGRGTLRATPKGKHFDMLYAIAAVPAFRPSLEFIAEVLVSTGRHFLAFPNLDNDLSIDITTLITLEKPDPAITGIVIGGRDILTLDSPDHLDEKGIPLYSVISEDELKARLARETALPRSRQILNFPDLSEPPQKLRYPYGYSMAWSG